MGPRLLHLSLACAVTLVSLPSPASAQEEEPAQGQPDAPAPVGAPLDPDSYVALSADQNAQSSLGGFRLYLERTRAADEGLYRVLDLRLDALESRDTAADVIFWTGTALSVAALVTSIPVYTEVAHDAAYGLIIGGASTFVLALIIQAIVRPTHDDLVALIDLHDERLGRR